MLPRSAWPIWEPLIAKNFRDNFVKHALAQSNLGDPRLITRVLLRVAFEVAFENLDHHEAVREIAAALEELNAEHAQRPIA